MVNVLVTVGSERKSHGESASERPMMARRGRPFIPYVLTLTHPPATIIFSLYIP